MAKKLFLIGCLFVMLVLSTIACGGTKAKLGQEFSLHIGESASIEGEELRIRFIEVVEDSRCPRGAECVWAGQIKCAVEITHRGPSQRVDLTQPGLAGFPPEESFKQYIITFRIEPYPVLGKEISEDEYLLVLTITKSM